VHTRAPPVKYTAGIDSIHLRFRGINKFDIDGFCKTYFLRYEEKKGKSQYQQEWLIFLAGGQPITVRYHFSSKTTTFEIGRLMNYSRKIQDQHHFLQNILYHFRERKMTVSRLDFAVDVKHPTVFKSTVDTSDFVKHKTTCYHNSNGRTFTIYNKAMQLKLYSIEHLTRYELRLGKKLSSWGVDNFIDNRESLLSLVEKAEKLFVKEYLLYCEHCSLVMLSTNLYPEFLDILENFIGFIQGDKHPAIKDHHKITIALEKRDAFMAWMSTNGLSTINDAKKHIKGQKQVVCREIGISDKTLAKILSVYGGIPNFKV
jgi:hypothetical protein